jgi:hypothetical protein
MALHAACPMQRAHVTLVIGPDSAREARDLEREAQRLRGVPEPEQCA